MVILDNNRLIVHAVELGMTVIGATSNSSNPNGGLAPTLGEAGARIQQVGDPPNIETVSALRPDLIIYNTRYDLDLALLEPIAPVVVFDGPSLPKFGLFDPLRWLGAMLGREAQAQQLEADIRTTFTESGSAVGLAGKRVAMINMINYEAGNNVFMYTASDSSGEFGQLLGAQIIPTEFEGQAVTEAFDVSVEVLPTLLADADAMIVGVYGGSEENAERAAERKEATIWRKIPAVERGDVVYTNIQYITHNYGLSGLRLALDDIRSQLRS
jgi:ABC-type Fe3+-hydroxamate transport system substrate-binding protein